MRPNVIAVVVAAGKGVRAGGELPKQHRPIGGRTAFERSLALFAATDSVDAILPVIRAADAPQVTAALARLRAGFPDAAILDPVEGGAERQESVRRALESLAAADPSNAGSLRSLDPPRFAGAPRFVLIHDAARPFTPTAVVDRVVAALRGGAEAVCPALPVADTLRRAENGRAGALVERDGLVRAQTPQGFAFPALLAAHRALADAPVTDDAELIARMGGAVTLVEGAEDAFKITTPADFARADTLAGAGAAPDMTDMTDRDPMEYRTGTGFDVHAFGANADGSRDHVWLCGVAVPHEDGLKGHSDADVGLHALTDAVLGALADGDIGAHFPPSDAQWRGAASDRFLRFAAERVAGRGGRITHLDVTLICERPKIRPHVEAMRARIAGIAGLGVGRVSVKATTTEQLGFTGRREGIAAMASATVALPPEP